MVNRFILNEVSYFGPGARKELPGVVKRLGFKKALVVTDKGLMQFGVAKMVLDVMDEAGIKYEIFDDVKPNPTVTNVKNGIEACKKAGADFIVAIGGGSSMDTAKGIGIVVNNPEFGDIVSLEGVADTKKKSLPIIALPTTAGTAAETTINYVIIDESRQAKMVCVDPNDIPCVAIIDAELMYSLPKSLTAATGMDAMTHAIEGLITKAAWELSDMFEVKAIEMIHKYLPVAVNEPTNPVGRDGMAVAQYVAGMAFSNVGLGVDHGMAHPLCHAAAHRDALQHASRQGEICGDSQGMRRLSAHDDHRRGCRSRLQGHRRAECYGRHQQTAQRPRYCREGHRGAGRTSHQRCLHARQSASRQQTGHHRPVSSDSVA